MSTPDAKTIIKEAMGYTKEPHPSCQTCTHSQTDEDQTGMWFYSCRLNPAFHFTVDGSARCNHFDRKENLKP